jgi:hypothetical protein
MRSARPWRVSSPASAGRASNSPSVGPVGTLRSSTADSINGSTDSSTDNAVKLGISSEVQAAGGAGRSGNLVLHCTVACNVPAWCNLISASTA